MTQLKNVVHVVPCCLRYNKAPAEGQDPDSDSEDEPAVLTGRDIIPEGLIYVNYKLFQDAGSIDENASLGQVVEKKKENITILKFYFCDLPSNEFDPNVLKKCLNYLTKDVLYGCKGIAFFDIFGYGKKYNKYLESWAEKTVVNTYLEKGDGRALIEVDSARYHFDESCSGDGDIITSEVKRFAKMLSSVCYDRDDINKQLRRSVEFYYEYEEGLKKECLGERYSDGADPVWVPHGV